MWFRLLFVLLSVVELSKLIAVEIQPEGIYHPFVVSIDRRPDKDLSYSMCIGLFKNKSLNVSFITATTPIGDRECAGVEELKFDYSGDGSSERIVSEDGKVVSRSLADYGAPRDAAYKGKSWRFSVLPNRITVKTPAHSETEKILEDSFCITYIRTSGAVDKSTEATLLACDDCSSIQRCVDTELPTKKPLSIGGKKVGAVPHKKHRSEEQYVIHETSPAKRREAPAL